MFCFYCTLVFILGCFTNAQELINKASLTLCLKSRIALNVRFFNSSWIARAHPVWKSSFYWYWKHGLFLAFCANVWANFCLLSSLLRLLTAPNTKPLIENISRVLERRSYSITLNKVIMVSLLVNSQKNFKDMTNILFIFLLRVRKKNPARLNMVRSSLVTPLTNVHRESLAAVRYSISQNALQLCAGTFCCQCWLLGKVKWPITQAATVGIF